MESIKEYLENALLKTKQIDWYDNGPDHFECIEMTNTESVRMRIKYSIQLVDSIYIANIIATVNGKSNFFIINFHKSPNLEEVKQKCQEFKDKFWKDFILKIIDEVFC